MAKHGDTKMNDPFQSNATGLTSPGRNAEAVTPSNDADLPTTARALYIGGAGDVALITAGGNTATFTGLSAGQILPITAARVLATATTATNIVAIW
jgi:hypothetical protein